MSKICPNCHAEYDDNHGFCSECGTKLIDKPTDNPALNLGDANAISGGISINQSKNVSSHDVHYHTIQQGAKSEKEIQQERYNKYHDEVSKSLKNGVITSEARANLDTIKFQLGLDTATATKIETAVKNEQRAKTKATNDGLSIIGKMALKSAMQAIEQNSPLAEASIRKLAPICKTTMNEQVHFVYNMLLAAFEPEDCVKAYENHTVDSYWQSYWASMAYRKLGNDGEAEAIVTEMTGLWQERPEINLLINACIGILLANNGNLEECQDLIIEYLTQSSEEPSEELNTLFQALLHLVGVVETDSLTFAFYNDYFLTSTRANAITPKAKSPKKQKAEPAVKQKAEPIVSSDIEATPQPSKKEETKAESKPATEEAEKLYEKAGKATGTKRVMLLQKAADAGSLEAMFDLSDCYCDGIGIKKDMTLAIKWLTKAADEGYVLAQAALGGQYLIGNDALYQNLSLAEKYLLAAAEKGEPHAMGVISCLYIETEEFDKAMKWARKGAQVADVTAYLSLARIYDEGLGVETNHIEGLKWYENAAKGGDADAQNICGNIYLNADYIDNDAQKAFTYYQMAASQSHVDGMANLGYCYMEGLGTDVNLLSAENWLRKAAEAGNEDAANILESNFNFDSNIQSQLTCPECGSFVEQDTVSCPNCGYPLKSDSSPANESQTTDISTLTNDSKGKEKKSEKKKKKKKNAQSKDENNKESENSLPKPEISITEIESNGRNKITVHFNIKNLPDLEGLPDYIDCFYVIEWYAESRYLGKLFDVENGSYSTIYKDFELHLKTNVDNEINFRYEIHKIKVHSDKNEDLGVVCSTEETITVYYEGHIFHKNVLTIK